MFQAYLNLWRYIRAFIFYYLILYGIFIVFGLIFPDLLEGSSKSINLAIAFSSTIFPYQRFIKDHRRILSSSEYWAMVLSAFSFAAGIQAALLIFSLMTGNLPPLSPALWAVVLLTALLMTFVPFLVGFSKWTGKSLLKAEMRRQAAAGGNSN
jgi:hypothetical protein